MGYGYISSGAVVDFTDTKTGETLTGRVGTWTDSIMGAPEALYNIYVPREGQRPAAYKVWRSEIHA